jgi:hypothetical protein
MRRKLAGEDVCPNLLVALLIERDRVTIIQDKDGNLYQYRYSSP